MARLVSPATPSRLRNLSTVNPAAHPFGSQRAPINSISSRSPGAVTKATTRQTPRLAPRVLAGSSRTSSGVLCRASRSLSVLLRSENTKVKQTGPSRIPGPVTRPPWAERKHFPWVFWRVVGLKKMGMTRKVTVATQETDDEEEDEIVAVDEESMIDVNGVPIGILEEDSLDEGVETLIQAPGEVPSQIVFARRFALEKNQVAGCWVARSPRDALIMPHLQARQWEKRMTMIPSPTPDSRVIGDKVETLRSSKILRRVVKPVKVAAKSLSSDDSSYAYKSQLSRPPLRSVSPSIIRFAIPRQLPFARPRSVVSCLPSGPSLFARLPRSIPRCRRSRSAPPELSLPHPSSRVLPSPKPGLPR
jgi:hypothetical protein